MQVSPNTIEFAKTMLEYMTEKLTRSFASARVRGKRKQQAIVRLMVQLAVPLVRTHVSASFVRIPLFSSLLTTQVVPFQLEKIRLATSLEQLDSLAASAGEEKRRIQDSLESTHQQRWAKQYGRGTAPPMPPLFSLTPSGRRPCVVLTSFPSLECGFARDLFLKWNSDSRNLILFTDASSLIPGSTGAQLATQPTPRAVSMQQLTRVPLMGAELRRWEEAKEEEARAAARARDAARVRSDEAAELQDVRLKDGGAEGAPAPASSSSSASSSSAVAGSASASAAASTAIPAPNNRSVAAAAPGVGRGHDRMETDGTSAAAAEEHIEAEEEPLSYTDDEDDEMALGRDMDAGLRSGVPHGVIAAIDGGSFISEASLSAGRIGPLHSAGAAAGHASSAAAAAGGLAARYPMFGCHQSADAPAASESAAPLSEKDKELGIKGPWSHYGIAIDPRDFKGHHASSSSSSSSSGSRCTC